MQVGNQIVGGLCKLRCSQFNSACLLSLAYLSRRWNGKLVAQLCIEGTTDNPLPNIAALRAWQTSNVLALGFACRSLIALLSTLWATISVAFGLAADEADRGQVNVLALVGLMAQCFAWVSSHTLNVIFSLMCLVCVFTMNGVCG